MNDTKTETKIEVKKITIPKVGKLILSDKVKEYIDCLHRKVGALEWSGILFYKLIEGDIKLMKDLVFQSDFIYPRDIGSHSYTTTSASGDVSDAYDVYEAGIECSTGLIHSHNNFNTFFSGTDMDELYNNAKMFRDFTYIDDVIAAIIKIIDKKDLPEGHHILNVGKGKPDK